VLDLQLHGVLQRIGFRMRPRRIFRRLLGNQQLIADRLDMLTDRRPGEGKNPGVKEPRKSCRPCAQRFTPALTFAIAPKR
jgi:hypothetical protein